MIFNSHDVSDTTNTMLGRPVYGCGVTASKSLPAGTKLSVRITSKGSTFLAFGKVAYATSEGDMGIVFTQIERNDQTILEKWINELRNR